MKDAWEKVKRTMKILIEDTETTATHPSTREEKRPKTAKEGK
jgi:hypothetical protein